jgi:tetratricopeptide (TPR) repeat protein
VALLALASLSLLVLVGSRGVPRIDVASGALADGSEQHDVSASQALERERRARFLLQRRATGDLERARSLFEEAVELDPRYARAHAGLASVYWLQTMYGQRPPEVGLELLRHAAEAALALDPRCAEAQLRLANRAMRLGQRDQQARYLRKAYAYGASEPLILSLRASTALRSGSVDAGIRLAQRAIAAAPFDLTQRYNFASELYMAGRLTAAIATMRELLELDPGHDADVLVLALVLQGSHDEAIAVAARQSDAFVRDYCLAIAHAAAGQRAESSAALARLEAATERGQGDPLRVAEVLAFRGEHDLAFAWLERARPGIELHGAWRGARMAPWIFARSPLAKSLRTDPRWERWWRAVT